MKIKREKLLKQLQDFVAKGNGIIIGSPGIGKTYLLKELRRNLESSGTLHLLLPIDQLGDGTDETLRQELHYEGDFIKKLKSISTSRQKSILLFDAFDATRDENTRRRFLSLMRRAIQELKGSWNVVVTVRTYDAKKSHALLDLFGNPSSTKYQSEEIPCRHLAIPPLNEDEIRKVFEKIPALESIFNSASQEFKRLLAIPFNLWMLQKIIMSSQVPPDFSEIYSEVQLLDMFWQRRVEGASNGDYRWSILERVARRMVVERSLTIKRSDISEALDLDTPTKQAAWNELQSDEILAKVSSTGLRIAFSHNILFDYAISVLLIEDDSQQLEDFILEDESRPLFLRPSLTYFFTRLWYKAPETFWKAFWHVFPSNQSVHLRLVARLIPTRVIANEAREIGQLSPLLEKLKKGEGIANEAVMSLLQSLRALQIQRDPLWSDFFKQITKYLHSDFAWDLAILTAEILERAMKAENTVVINACGQIGRRLLKWIWKERQTGEDDWYHRLAGSRVVPLVAKTYGTNPEESQKLLEKVLKLTQEDDFPIDIITRLTEHVDRIWDEDPEFVVSTYVTVFTHQEISGEITNPMGGRILALTSTRRQDYSMCHYWLAQHFPNFLRAKLIPAARAVIRSLNFYIIRTQILNHRRETVELQDMVEPFEFGDKTAYLLPDLSHIWDEREILDEPIKMADALFEFIVELAMSKESFSRLNSLLYVFRDEVWVAFFWKRLLNTAVQHPEIFAPRLIDLCIAKPILMSNDALFELGEFLYAAAPIFTPNQRLQIENAILGLTSETGENGAFLEDRRNQLLARIPPTLLLTPEAKTIRGDMERENSVPENRPLVSFSPVTWSDYPEEEQLQDEGVDTTTSENQELQRFFEPLEEFRSNWLNKAPTEEATELILPLLQEAYSVIKSDTEADKEVIDRLWYKLTACTAILGRVANDPESPRFVFCREVLLDAAKHELPTPDSERDAEFDFPSYSPCPRHEAAQGLLRLTARQSDPEMLDAIESLASDPVPSVRMVTAMGLFQVYDTNPDRFWHIVELMATHETNSLVQKYIYAPLTHVVWRKEENEDRTTRVMDMLFKRTVPPTEGLEPSDPFIILLMRLAIYRENSWALKTIEDTFFQDPIRFANLLDRAVFRVIKDFVTPKNIETPDGRETAKRAIDWLGKVITVTVNGIQELSTTPHDQRSEEIHKKLHGTYRVIEKVIMRLYFEVVHQRDRSQEPSEKIPRELRCRFYNEVKPLMKQVVYFAADRENGLLFAPTAYRFMQLLTSFLSCNPTEVLHLAAGVARSSERFGYNLDALAVQDVVKFVEIVLADHRSEVREGQALEDLLNLLDIFAKAGWSDALKLVWRLDEVFR